MGFLVSIGEIVLNIPLATFGVFAMLVGVSKYWQSKSLTRWSFRRLYYFFAYEVWGLGFLLVGVTNFNSAANLVYGCGFILMAFVPCGMEVINQYPILRIPRNIFFAGMGLFIIFGPR